MLGQIKAVLGILDILYGWVFFIIHAEMFHCCFVCVGFFCFCFCFLFWFVSSFFGGGGGGVVCIQ